MRTGHNCHGNLLLWLCDGTQIILSEEATKKLKCKDTNEILMELMRMIMKQ